ncbi:hypothetical protein NVS47_08550 [Dehalobacterium formicoaceticum]|uniref:Uncharacterized protein n=1 Tax=Dehalobacterium formicoaceticum TaxID=51515 RepID=A0ABT1Y6M3_9FIRM|nr:hypothetical protein [Dehalobacterium formicoaceticum]MCR6545559.1 hypothetical protein [Dehalobacterium formicoaceticum]
MIYKMMEPPFEMNDFELMNKKEAKQHFDWYVAQIPERIVMLQEYLSIIAEKEIHLDYGVDSLRTVWELFETEIKLVPKSKEEIEKELKETPDWILDEIELTNLSQETLIVAMDIAIYFAEVFVKNNEGIYWSFYTKPKSRSSVNRPILLGFKNGADMDPRVILLNCCDDSLHNNDPELLVKLYHIWCEKI